MMTSEEHELLALSLLKQKDYEKAIVHAILSLKWDVDDETAILPFNIRDHGAHVNDTLEDEDDRP